MSIDLEEGYYNLQTELLLPYYGKALAHLNDVSETEEYENLDQIMQNPDDSIDAYNWQ